MIKGFLFGLALGVIPLNIFLWRENLTNLKQNYQCQIRVLEQDQLNHELMYENEALKK